MKASGNAKKKQEESISVILENLLGTLSNFLIGIYLLLILVGLPLYYQEGYTHIGADKSFFFCKASIGVGKLLLPILVLYLVVWMAIHWRKRKAGASGGKPYRIKEIISAGGADWFVALYGLAQVLSYGFSRYRENVLWGTEGWYMGFWPQIFLVASYFLISRLWKPRKWMLSMMLVASAAVFLLGYLNRFSVYPIEMAWQGPGYISTIGNINWYCGYVVSVLFVAVTLLWMQDSRKQNPVSMKNLLLMAYVALGFATLLTQGSDSGIMALIAMMIVYFCLSASDGERMERFWHLAALLWGACAVTCVIWRIAPERLNYANSWMEVVFSWPMLLLSAGICSCFLCWLGYRRARCAAYPEKGFRIAAAALVSILCLGMAVLVGLIILNTLRPGILGRLSSYPLFTFSEDWGSLRGATWKAGFMCFAQQDFLHKIVGVGPDSMWEAISGHGSEELQNMVRNNFGNLHLTNAHNEWLTVLVNTGILGAIGFVGMMVSGIRSFLSEKGRNVYAYACGFCLLAYTVNNFFSFQQSVSTPTIFVLFGMGRAFQRSLKESTEMPE